MSQPNPTAAPPYRPRFHFSNEQAWRIVGTLISAHRRWNREQSFAEYLRTRVDPELYADCVMVCEAGMIQDDFVGYGDFEHIIASDDGLIQTLVLIAAKNIAEDALGGYLNV